MDFGTVHNLKRAVLIDFVATMARLLTRHGNRIGALLTVELSAPSRRAAGGCRCYGW